MEQSPKEETVLDKRMTWLRKELDPSKITLEIAPYFNPMVPRDEGKVWYTDYIDNRTIQKKAARYAGNLAGRFPSKIDFVWKPGRRLKRCSPRADFDFVVASHVLEHVPNPIGWINELLSVLKIGGAVLLVLPDRRLTHDHYRHETTFAELLTFAIEGLSRPSPGQILDYTTNVIEDYGADGVLPYTSNIPFAKSNRLFDDKRAILPAILVKAIGRYTDIHCTVWTASSFEEAFSRVSAGGYINGRVETPAENHIEFMVKIVKVAGSPVPLRPILDLKPFWMEYFGRRYWREIVGRITRSRYLKGNQVQL